MARKSDRKKILHVPTTLEAAPSTRPVVRILEERRPANEQPSSVTQAPSAMNPRNEHLAHVFDDAMDPGRRKFCLQACLGVAWLGRGEPVPGVARSETPSPPTAPIEPEIEASFFELSDPGWTY